MPSRPASVSIRLVWIAAVATVLIGLVAGLVMFDQLQPKTVLSHELDVRIDGVRTLDGEPFTGVAVMYYDEEVAQLAQRVEYRDGRRHGMRHRWFANGVLASKSRYDSGRRDGAGMTYWDNGSPRTSTTFSNGRAHGVSTQWYREGMKFKERTLVDGRERGLQRAWRRNGKLYANYEAVDGRNYGLHQTDLCIEVEE